MPVPIIHARAPQNEPYYRTAPLRSETYTTSRWKIYQEIWYDTYLHVLLNITPLPKALCVLVARAERNISNANRANAMNVIVCRAMRTRRIRRKQIIIPI